MSFPPQEEPDAQNTYPHPHTYGAGQAAQGRPEASSSV